MVGRWACSIQILGMWPRFVYIRRQSCKFSHLNDVNVTDCSEVPTTGPILIIFVTIDRNQSLDEPALFRLTQETHAKRPWGVWLCISQGAFYPLFLIFSLSFYLLKSYTKLKTVFLDQLDSLKALKYACSANTLQREPEIISKSRKLTSILEEHSVHRNLSHNNSFNYFQNDELNSYATSRWEEILIRLFFLVSQ